MAAVWPEQDGFKTAPAAVVEPGNTPFVVKDSGKREEYTSGMVRDVEDGKIDYLRVFDGPLIERYAAHLTKAAVEKYHDPVPGVPNWTLADGKAELTRARKSALRHLIQWLRGKRDEDHASAVVFNLNLAEYITLKMRNPQAAAETLTGFPGLLEETDRQQ